MTTVLCQVFPGWLENQKAGPNLQLRAALAGPGEGQSSAVCSRVQADCLWDTQRLSLPAAGIHPVLQLLTRTGELQSNPVLFEMLKGSLEGFSFCKGQDMPLAQSIGARKTFGELNIQLHAAQPGRWAAKVPLLHPGSSAKAADGKAASLLAEEEAPSPSGFSFACPIDGKFIQNRAGQ